MIRLELVGDADGAIPRLPGLKRSPFVDPAAVPGLYARCDLVLLPYRPDLAHAGSISPIKLFEAMAAGRPVIASDLPTIAEVVRDGETGLLVPPADADAWAAAVRRLVEDPALARRLAEAGRALAPAYDWLTRAQTIARAHRLPADRRPRRAADRRGLVAFRPAVRGAAAAAGAGAWAAAGRDAPRGRSRPQRSGRARWRSGPTGGSAGRRARRCAGGGSGRAAPASSETLP